MPANWRDYLFWWELPVVLAFLAGWVLGGGHILRWSLRRRGALKRMRLRGCAGVCILAGGAGALAGGAMIVVMSAIGEHFRMDLKVLGFILAGMAAAAVSYLVIFAIFELPAKAAVTVWGPSLGAVGVLAAILGTPTALIARHLGRDARNLKTCQARAENIFMVLRRHEQDFRSLPNDLRPLIDKKLLPEELLTCPVSGKKQIGYFYLRPQSIREPINPKQILLCDYRDNHGGKGRSVILVSGDLRTYSEKEFQDLLDQPDNALFAQALRAVEGP